MFRVRLVLTSILLLAAAAWPQQPPRCDDADCQTLARLIADAPHGYASFRGRFVQQPGDSAPTYECTFRLAGFDKCAILREGTFSTMSLTLTRQDGAALYARLKTVVQAAAPSWCVNDMKGVDDNFFTLYSCSEGTVSKHQILMRYNTYGAPQLDLSISIPPLSDTEVRSMHAVGTLKMTGLPEGALAGLTVPGQYSPAYSGTADSAGDLVIRGIHPGTYKLHITAFGHKPYDHPQDLTFAGDDTQIPSVHMEPGPLSLAEIVEALKKNVPPERIKSFVTELGVDFSLNDDTEKQLRDAGADAELLVVIAKNKK